MYLPKGMETLSEEERHRLIEHINSCAKKKDWEKIISDARFRYYKGQSFKLDDVNYFRRYVAVFGEDVSSRVNACYINYVQILEKTGLSSYEGADLYVKNFLICYYFSEFMYATFPNVLRVMRNSAFMNYSLLQETGLVLFNAAKKINSRPMEDITNILRRSSFTKTRDVYMQIIAEYPDDLRSRMRLKKVLEAGPPFSYE